MFGAGHGFPIVSKLRRGQEADTMLPASPGHALTRGNNGMNNGRHQVISSVARLFVSRVEDAGRDEQGSVSDGRV